MEEQRKKFGHNELDKEPGKTRVGSSNYKISETSRENVGKYNLCVDSVAFNNENLNLNSMQNLLLTTANNNC